MSIGDHKKYFTEIYNRESDSVFRFCLVRVSDRERALDLTQETFTRLWHSIVSGKKVENPRALLFVTARHLVIDWYRKKKSVSLESLSVEGGRPLEFPDQGADDHIEISADAERVILALDQLAPQYKEVVYLRYVEDLPPREIGEMLGLSPNVVSLRITRGMESLRKIMGISKPE